MNNAVFWDFDGTLAASPMLWSRSAHSALLEQAPGCGAALGDIRPFMRTGFTWHTPERDYSHLTGEKWWEFMFGRFAEIYRALGIPEAGARAAARRVRSHILRIDNYTLYPDSETALEACVSAGWRNYIVSNNYPELPETIMRLGLSRHFSGYAVSSLIGYDKPRVEIFGHALRMAGHPDISLMVGDNPVADIEGAKPFVNATVLVHSDKPSRADHTFASLTDVVDLL